MTAKLRPALAKKGAYTSAGGPHKKHRPPLRSFRELCEELGVAPARMSVIMGRHNGPKVELNHSAGSRVHANSWYNPVEFRRWWAALSEDQRR